MAQLSLKKPIAFFDLETTGVDPAKDRIVEIAIIKLNPDGTREIYEKRVNPERKIPAETTAIHGITDEDVANAPTFKEIAHDVYNFIKNCDLGGYNSNKFDIPCFAEELLRAGIEVDFKKRKLVGVQQIFYKMEPRTLSAAYKFYCGGTLENAHSALADIDATVKVLESQLDMYKDSIENDVETIHKFTGGEDFVDYARRMVLKNGVPIFNFGKHKGQTVEDVLRREPQYYDWMMSSDFSLHTKQCLSEILNKMMLKK